MKKVRTIRIDKEVSDNLDSICNRHGDVSWHIEQALNGYKPIKELTPRKSDKVMAATISDLFDTAWNIYEKKGNRKSSLAKFSKLLVSTQKIIIDKLPSYVLSTPDKQYRKNFETYINQECWNDEVTPNGPNQSGRPATASRGTPAQRTRAACERWEAEQESNVPAMGSDAGNLRPSMEQPVRRGADRIMGETLDGDYTRTD